MSREPRDALHQAGESPEDTVSTWNKGQVRRLETPAQTDRKTKRRPHEAKRSARLVAITFPSPEWKDYIKAKAAELGDEKRQSDLLVYCLSYAFAALESGELEPPDLGTIKGHQRAGEAFDLPFEPS